MRLYKRPVNSNATLLYRHENYGIFRNSPYSTHADGKDFFIAEFTDDGVKRIHVYDSKLSVAISRLADKITKQTRGN